MRMIAQVRVTRVAATMFAILGFAVWLDGPAMAESRGAEAETFIAALAQSGVAMLETKDYTDTEREREFRRLARAGFALEAIGQFVAGRHWRGMSDDQRAEFQELFAEWLLSSYAGRLGSYDGQSLEIVKTLELQNRAQDALVQTRVIYTDGQPSAAVGWRVRAFDGELKIIDVIVEGVSMAAAQRAEFDSVIRKVGVEGLLANLRSRLTVLVADKE